MFRCGGATRSRMRMLQIQFQNLHPVCFLIQCLQRCWAAGNAGGVQSSRTIVVDDGSVGSFIRLNFECPIAFFFMKFNIGQKFLKIRINVADFQRHLFDDAKKLRLATKNGMGHEHKTFIKNGEISAFKPENSCFKPYFRKIWILISDLFKNQWQTCSFIYSRKFQIVWKFRTNFRYEKRVHSCRTEGKLSYDYHQQLGVEIQQIHHVLKLIYLVERCKTTIMFYSTALKILESRKSWNRQRRS